MYYGSYSRCYGTNSAIMRMSHISHQVGVSVNAGSGITARENHIAGHTKRDTTPYPEQMCDPFQVLHKVPRYQIVSEIAVALTQLC